MMNGSKPWVLKGHGEESSKSRKFNLVFDSGASNHMFNSEGPLRNVRPIPPRSIVLGNGATVSVLL